MQPASASIIVQRSTARMNVVSITQDPNQAM
jgi:hypothetical protein